MKLCLPVLALALASVLVVGCSSSAPARSDAPPSGLGFGAKTFDLVWVFRTPEAYQDLITRGIEIGGQATLAAKVDKAGGGLTGAVQVSDNVWVYQMTESGLAAELTVKGTRYYPDKALN